MKRAAAAIAVVTTIFVLDGGSLAQQSSTLQIQAMTMSELRVWDAYVTQRERSGNLRVRAVDRDPALPSRTVERFQQFHEHIPIWGAEVVRDSERGVPLVIFGVLSPDLTLSGEPALQADAATAALQTLCGGTAKRLTETELVILPLDSGEHRLAYTAIVSGRGDVFRVFVDANTGAELLRYAEIQRQAAVGVGRGVLGDTKKISVLRQAGAFVADDQHRPPVLITYDFRGNYSRLISVLNGGAVFSSDKAMDTDNDWTDVAAVDAHVHVGWTYDYYYKRFGRRGLDNRDRPITIFTNAVSQEGALTLPTSLLDLALNAFWCDTCGPGRTGVMFFGNGIPPGRFLVSTGNNYTYFAGALDIVAHELTHGVTASTSRLIYRNESGALNEAFSDMMGTSVEFFYHQPGSGLGKADYVIGEDISRAVRAGSRDGDRSLENPGLYGDPDHYSRRYIGAADDGGVHTNSGIANQAFYLAIEGGTNRTSRMTVQGVGSANREQIEKVFHRAFTLLMPASSTFSTARAATAQAARDLYGQGGSVERAVIQAWSAVGVFEQPTLNFSFSPSPAIPRTTQCSTLTPPCWPFRVTVQESSGFGFNVARSSIRFYDSNQTLLGVSTNLFSDYYSACGPGSSRIQPRGTACLEILIGLGGRASGYVDFLLEGRDDNGTSLSFMSGLQRLSASTAGVVPTVSFLAPGAEGIVNRTRR